MEKKSNKESIYENIEKFSIYQKELLDKEKEEEELETSENIQKHTAKTLEKKGICIRKVSITDMYTGLYGKYICEFQKKSKKDNIKSEFKSYKFGNGDIVGLFEYDLYIINKEPLFSGIVYELSENKLLVSFDDYIDLTSLPTNLALVQLSNQITFKKINIAIDNLNKYEENDNKKLINILFNKEKPEVDEEFMKNNYNKIEFLNKNLNKSQKDAIMFSLASKDISLIHGPPGTGKTTTVVEFILQSLKYSKKILAVAPSNIALDNIAEKLINFKGLTDFKLCRIGHPARLMESVLKISLDFQIKDSNSTKIIQETKNEIEKINKKLNSNVKIPKDEKYKMIGELRNLRKDVKRFQKKAVFEILNRSDIILATCVGADDRWLRKCMLEWSNKLFDLVVIDECAQATEACCWIPILMGKKIVLAGDHLQLPPTIKSKSAEEGLSYTLFDRMMKTYGDDISRMLKIQYRMNENIMNFSSKELYSNELKADDSVKSHLLNDLFKHSNYSIQDNLELIKKSLILIDTSPYIFHECLDAESESKFNFGEVMIIKHFISYLKSNLFLRESDIGIITPYSAQVNCIKQEIRGENNELEISTVDGFQGREKEVIILSLVRSNIRKEVGFLAEKRRLNVAITRAKRLLILICDVTTCSNDPFINKLIVYLKENNAEFCLTDAINYGEIQEITESVSQKIGKIEQNIKQNEKDKVKIIGKKGEKKEESKKKKKKDKKESDNKENNINTEKIKNLTNTEELSHTKINHHSEEKINSIKKKIENFIKNNSETSLEINNVNNNERRLLHDFCEQMNLNHLSKGENEERYLLITKRLNNIEQTKNKNEDILKNKEDDILIEEIVEIPKVEEVKKKEIINTSKKIPEENKGNNFTKKNQKPEISEEDDLDKLLDSFQQEQNKCHFPNCLFYQNKETFLCSYCKTKFCFNHYSQYEHNCADYRNQSDHKDLLNSYKDKMIKKEVKSKINDFQKDRQKKMNTKKKK